MAGTDYARLNLRWNPFGAMTRSDKQALTVPRLDLSPFVEKLRQPGYAVQFLRAGAPGKTTHLFFIRDHFPEAPCLCLDQHTHFPMIPKAPVIFLDQLQEMPLHHRLMLFRRRASFALVSHRNHRWEFRLTGLDYDLVSLPAYSAVQMKEAIDRRLAWACLDPRQPLPTINLDTIVNLLERHGSDVAVLNYLYDHVEALAQQSCKITGVRT